MNKKTYSQPITNIVALHQQHHLLDVSNVSTTSTSSDVQLNYDKNGGEASEAW